MKQIIIFIALSIRSLLLILIILLISNCKKVNNDKYNIENKTLHKIQFKVEYFGAENMSMLFKTFKSLKDIDTISDPEFYDQSINKYTSELKSNASFISHYDVYTNEYVGFYFNKNISGNFDSIYLSTFIDSSLMDITKIYKTQNELQFLTQNILHFDKEVVAITEKDTTTIGLYKMK